MVNSRQTGQFFPDLLSSLYLVRIWRFLAINDLRVRFARSRLGFGWIVLSFAVWAIGVGTVYAQLFELKASEFVPFLTLGFALWGFITSSIVESGNAFIVAAGYVKQFNLPKQIYVWRMILSQVIAFGFTLLICILIVVWFKPQALANLPLAIPGMVLLLLACALQSFLVAYLTPYIRDLPHAASSALNVVFFITPIIFPSQLLRTRGLEVLSEVNPFYFLIEGVRRPLLEGGLAEAAVYRGAVLYVALLVVAMALVCPRLDRRVVYAL